MSLQIITCDQNSPEWFQARMGIPTASMFGTVMAKGKDGGASATRKNYLFKLAGEIISGEPMENYQNANMERGHEMEKEARSWFAFLSDSPLERVGFIRNGQKGCSPDSLIGADGMVEFKSNQPHIIIDLILKDQFPPEHMAQCMGALWIAEREWIDLCCYWPSMPKFVQRLHRDEAYIAKLSAAIDAFNDELQEIVSRIRARAA